MNPMMFLVLLSSTITLVHSKQLVNGRHEVNTNDVDMTESMSPVNYSSSPDVSITEAAHILLDNMNHRFLAHLKHLDDSSLNSTMDIRIKTFEEIQDYDDYQRRVTLLGFFNNSGHDLFNQDAEVNGTETATMFQQIQARYVYELGKMKEDNSSDAEQLIQELLNLTRTEAGRDLLWSQIFSLENIDQEDLDVQEDHVDEIHFDLMTNDEEFNEETNITVGNNETIKLTVTANSMFWGRDCSNDTMCTDTIAWCDTEVDQCRPVWWFYLIIAMLVLMIVGAIVFCIIKGTLDCLCSSCCKP